MSRVGGLHPEYKTYEQQKCFIGHSREAEWHDDILSAYAAVLPKFDLEPWYAADHFDPTKPLRDKVVELIANARYGIYDLSSWQDRSGEWHLPRNVFIELGMAIVLNRPALLLRHTSNKPLPLPACLQGVELLDFAGETTLKRALEERLPQWLDIPPERDWLNRSCIFGKRVCDFREAHPRARQWGHETLRCHISDGLDRDHPGFQTVEREEIRGVFEDILSRYSDLEFDYLDELSLADGYQFLLCSHCQAVRSTPFTVYRILPHTPAEVFIAIGMSIALKTLFEYDIPKVLLMHQKQDLPSLLEGYEVVEAVSSSEVKRKLKAGVPMVVQRVRETTWKPRRLPFDEITWVEIEPTPISMGPVSEANEASLVAKIVAVLDRLGANLEQEPVSRASGIDLIAEWDRRGVETQRLAIQVKEMVKPVGVDLVRSFAATFKSLQSTDPADEAIFVSASGFTAAAQNAAQESGVHLTDYDGLQALVIEVLGEGSRDRTSKAERTLLGDRYHIINTIAQTGFSEVFLALDRRLGRKVAIKRSNLLPLDPAARERFSREARIMAHLRHRHVISIHSLEEEGDNLYIVMEYADQGSLLDRIRASPSGLPITDVVGVGIAMCKALAAVHARGIIHLDPKSANVLLVTEEGKEKPVLKLADFGLARDTAAAPLISRSSVAGTLGYIPPEAFAETERQADERWDVYALGATLYEALTKHHPLGDTLEEIIRNLHHPPTSPRYFRSDVPAWLEQTVLKALAPTRDDRYPTMRAMLVDLEKARP